MITVLSTPRHRDTAPSIFPELSPECPFVRACARRCFPHVALGSAICRSIPRSISRPIPRPIPRSCESWRTKRKGGAKIPPFVSISALDRDLILSIVATGWQSIVTATDSYVYYFITIIIITMFIIIINVIIINHFCLALLNIIY